MTFETPTMPLCRGCRQTLDPFYYRRYDGYCLNCANAGRSECDAEIERLKTELASVTAERDELRKAIPFNEPSKEDVEKIKRLLRETNARVSAINAGMEYQAACAAGPWEPPPKWDGQNWDKPWPEGLFLAQFFDGEIKIANPASYNPVWIHGQSWSYRITHIIRIARINVEPTDADQNKAE